MKRFLFILLIAALTIGSTHAQRFIAGANAGIPVGDAEDLTTFVIAVELGYLFDLNENFQAGPKVEFKHYFGGEEDLGPLGTFEYDDESFIPIAGTARFSPAEAFWFGADLGYAIGVSEGNDGGFYYNPFLLYDFGAIAIKAGYSAITSDGFTLASINAGVEFGW